MAQGRSEAQREASRTNGARSRGPITPAGKRRSSLNATTHGLSARTVVLPDEDPDEFERFAAALADDIGPVGAIGQVLLERLAVTAWRLRRASQIEADVLNDERQESDGSTVALGLGFVRALGHGEPFSVLARHERAVERGFFAALHELERMPRVDQNRQAAAESGAEAEDEDSVGPA